MKRKILIVATKNWGKKKEDEYIAEAKAIMNSGNFFSEIQIDIEYRTFGFVETYIDNEGKKRITHDWFEKNISDDAVRRGYNSSRLRLEKTEGKLWGLTSGVRGVNYRDTPNDFHGEGWIISSVKNQVMYKGGSFRNQFPKTLAHEEGHELKYSGITNLEIHDYDTNNINNIEQFYKDLKSNHNAIIPTMIEQLKNQVAKLLAELSGRAVYPVDRGLFVTGVTQKWLLPNTIYQSGVHNGLDIGLPLFTPVKVPMNGMVYHSGVSEQLGYYCFFECIIDQRKLYFIFPHLDSIPVIGNYKKGEVVGKIGNTGMSFGSHLHITLLTTKPLNTSHYVSLVDTKEKVIKNTLDPYKFYLYAVDRKII